MGVRAKNARNNANAKNVQCLDGENVLAFGVWRLAFGVRRSAGAVRTSVTLLGQDIGNTVTVLVHVLILSILRTGISPTNGGQTYP